jgi:hypothetical protein
MNHSSRLSKRSLERRLQPAAIVVHGQEAIVDPHKFLHDHLGEDAIVVIESTDRVCVERLQELTSDFGAVLHAHGFSASRKAQARVARAAQGWVGDALRECEIATAGSRQTVAADGRMMCLGERGETSASGTTYGEARIKPYTLPIANGPAQVDVMFRNYFEETASGRLACIAHRVTGFVAREER